MSDVLLGNPSRKVRDTIVRRHYANAKMRIKATNGNTVYIPISELSNPIGYCTIDGTVLAPFNKYADISGFNTIAEIELSDDLNDGKDLSVGLMNEEGNVSGFYSCTNLTSIKFDKAKVVGDIAFSQNRLVGKLSLPNALSIYSGAFCQDGNNSMLTSVDAPKVEFIGYNAFNDCNSHISAVNMPQLKRIDAWCVFTGMPLVEIDLPELTTTYVTDATMGCALLQSCQQLTSANLPKLKNLTFSAFMGCRSLKSLNISSVVDVISSRFLFCNCQQLSAIELPNLKNATFDYASFTNCSSLKKIDFTGLTAVPTLADPDAFDGSADGIQVYIPESLLDEFTTADNWSALYEAGKFAFIGSEGGLRFNGLIMTSTNGCKCYVPYSSFSLPLQYEEEGGTGAIAEPFCNYPDIDTNDKLLRVEDGTKSKLSSIGSCCFMMCQNLEHVDAENIVEVNGAGSFGGTALSAIDFPNLSVCGSDSFFFCEKAISVNMPSLKAIKGTGAFQYMSQAMTMRFPQLTSIEGAGEEWEAGDYCFGVCTSLTSIEMPELKTMKGNSIFSYCSSLKQIILSSVTAVTTMTSKWNFSSTPDHISVYVPESLVDSFKEADNWSELYAEGKLDFIGVPDPRVTVTINSPHADVTIGGQAAATGSTFTAVKGQKYVITATATGGYTNPEISFEGTAIASGSEFAFTKSGYLVVTASSPYASSPVLGTKNGNEYGWEDLTTAIYEADSNTTLKLQKDVTLTANATLAAASKTLTIDGQSHKTNGNYCFNVSGANAHLTIKNLNSNNATNSGAFYVSVATGKMTLINCTENALKTFGVDRVITNSGTVEIEDCNLTGSSMLVLLNSNQAKLTMTNSTSTYSQIQTSYCNHVTLNSGTFASFNIGGNTTTYAKPEYFTIASNGPKFSGSNAVTALNKVKASTQVISGPDASGYYTLQDA